MFMQSSSLKVSVLKYGSCFIKQKILGCFDMNRQASPPIMHQNQAVRTINKPYFLSGKYTPEALIK